MINRIRVFISPLIVLVTSCIYQPYLADVPLISEKKDLRIDGGISMITASATVSYGLTKEISLQTFGSLGSDDKYYVQGAAGYFKNFGDYKIMEIYGGFGYGYGDAFRSSMPGDLYGDYQLYFTQFNFGKIKMESSKIEIGFGIKSGYFHSSLIDRNYYSWTGENGPYIQYHDDSFLIEPTVFLRLGGEHLKLSIKFGGCWIHKFTNIDKYLPYSKFNVGLGLNYRL